MKNMTRLVVALACATVSLAPLHAKTLKVLMIGNSFSQSNMAYFPNVASAYPDCTLDIANMNIGGCPLDRHWENVEKASNPDFRPYFISSSYTSGKAPKLPKRANIPEMLKADRWDVVTIQQASGKSPFADTYQPYADKLIAKIKELAPQAEIVIQQTWSYTPYDSRLNNWGMTPQTMYEGLKQAYGKLAAAHGFRQIPVGDAVQLYRKRLPVKYEKVLSVAERKALVKPDVIDFCGDLAGASHWGKGRKGSKDENKIALRIDASHLNNQGKYLQACTWLAALFGVDVTKLSWAPADIPPERAELMRRCAQDAVKGHVK